MSKKFQCPYCGKWFRTESGRDWHIKNRCGKTKSKTQSQTRGEVSFWSEEEEVGELKPTVLQRREELPEEPEEPIEELVGEPRDEVEKKIFEGLRYAKLFGRDKRWWLEQLRKHRAYEGLMTELRNGV